MALSSWHCVQRITDRPSGFLSNLSFYFCCIVEQVFYFQVSLFSWGTSDSKDFQLTEAWIIATLLYWVSKSKSPLKDSCSNCAMLIRPLWCFCWTSAECCILPATQHSSIIPAHVNGPDASEEDLIHGVVGR